MRIQQQLHAPPPAIRSISSLPTPATPSADHSFPVAEAASQRAHSRPDGSRIHAGLPAGWLMEARSHVSLVFGEKRARDRATTTGNSLDIRGSDSPFMIL